MPLVEDNHVVETLTSNGADYPFDKWILPRGARCGKDLLHPETVDASIEVRSVGLVSIPYQVPRRRVPWKSIDHLLRRPLGRRMFGDIEMNDTAKDDEDEQNSEGCGRQSEKVERHQVLCMIIKKAPPSRGRWRAMANHILGDGGLGNGDAQLCQLAMHAMVIHRRGPWRGPEDVELATLEWVHWYNTQGLLEPIGNVSPVEYEMNYYRSQEGSLEMARLN